MVTRTGENAAAVAQALAGLPPEQREAAFNEPWEAQAFAMTVAMHSSGLFSWSEWADALGRQIKLAQANGDPDLGATYYRHWLAAIETLVQEKGITDRHTLAHYQHAWDRAAHRTPHGEPIVLLPEDHADRSRDAGSQHESPD